MRCPVHGRVILFRDQQFACFAIQRVLETVAVEVDERLRRFALYIDIRQDHLVDAIIVPFVMGRHLEDPLGHAGIGVSREDRHGPLVVARTLGRVRGARIAAAVIDQVQLGVIGIPSPGGAAPGLPLIALPCRQRGVGADRFAHPRRLVGSEEDLIVGANRIGFPGQRPVFEVVSGEASLDPELAATDADVDLVLHDHGRHRHGFTLCRVTILDAPSDLAGLGVERHRGRVRLVQDDHAIAVGDTAIDRVAAHDRNDVRILVRLIVQDHATVVVEVEREHVVRKWRRQVHGVADDQRATFMAAKHTGGERPNRMEVLHIGSIDLIKRAITLVSIIARGHNPLISVTLQLL